MWKQGQREIKNIVVDIEVNDIKVQQVDCKKSERSLGVHMSPALVWDKQFEKMKEKMIEAVFKLKNTKIVVPTAHLYYNMYLIKKVYFGCGIVHLTEQQESELKKIYEPVLLKKLRLSENFPRSVLYSRKTALGVGLLAPRTIIDALALKLYLGHKRADDRIAKVIQINEDNARIQYGYSKSLMDVDRKVKPNKIIWSDKIQQKLSRRNLEIINRLEEPKWVS